MQKKIRAFARRFNRFLRWAPIALGGLLLSVSGLAVGAAQAWPKAKDFVELVIEWGASNMTWLLPLMLGVAIVWLVLFFTTLQSVSDLLSNEGAMTGDDYRKGNFNFGTNYGNQTYNEAPQQRTPPANLVHALAQEPKDGTVIQIRVYGLDFEMQTFGNELGNQLALAGFDVRMFGQDNGSRFLKGIVVEPSPNDVSRRLGSSIVAALNDSKTSVSLGSGPDSWKDQNFIRIGIGANT